MAFAVVPLRYVSVLATVLALVAAVAADSRSASSFSVAGRKFKILNRPIQLGEGAVCPEGTPTSTVVFCAAGKNVKIVGNFAAADLGVCDPAINPYTLPATTVVTYEQYQDIVVLRIPDRVPSAFRVMVVGGKKLGLGLSGQLYGVTTFIDDGLARC